jgi:hypothetical protein
MMNSTTARTSPREEGGRDRVKEGGTGGVPYLLRKAACYANNGTTTHSFGGGDQGGGDQ